MEVQRVGLDSGATMSGALEFESFYVAHRDRLVRGLSLALGDKNHAAEAVDEAMTRAVQRWSKVSQYAEPQAWVYRVAFNWATSRFRRGRRDRQYAPVVARPDRVVDEPGPDSGLGEALANLPIAQRSVVVLRYFFDWDVGRTAAALGIAEGTVKSRTSRALTALAEELSVVDVGEAQS